MIGSKGGDPDNFRKQKLYTQKTDAMFREYIGDITQIFEHYGDVESDTMIGHAMTLT
jgi:hypothetical protein